MQQFKIEYTNLKKLQISINRDLKKRQDLKQQNKLTGMIDSELRGQFSRFDCDLERLK